MDKLKILDLGENPISSVKDIMYLTDLEYLKIDRTQIQCVKDLNELPNLKSLQVSEGLDLRSLDKKIKVSISEFYSTSTSLITGLA